MSAILAQLAKAPVLNQVKTRMQPVLSASDSVRLHKLMVTFLAESLCSQNDWRYELWISEPHAFFSNLAERYHVSVVQQQGRDLGERLCFISQTAFSRSDVSKLILIGSDCPQLDSTTLHTLQRRIGETEADIVVQPALDGGYVALGVAAHHPALFEDIDWGTDKVLAQTKVKAKKQGLRVVVLDALADIDRPEDLKYLDGIIPFSVDPSA